jgi:hypothetical protein
MEMHMSEEPVDAYDELFLNRLKTVDVRTLEKTIAKAVTDLVGTELRCSIENIKFNDSYSTTSAAFNVSLHEPVAFDVGSHQSKSS